MPVWAVILLVVGCSLLFGLLVAAAVYAYIVYQQLKDWGQS